MERQDERAESAYESVRWQQHQEVRAGFYAMRFAQEARKIAGKAYQAGGVSLLVLLDAKRTANEAQLAYLQVLLDTFLGIGEIEFLASASAADR